MAAGDSRRYTKKACAAAADVSELSPVRAVGIFSNSQLTDKI
jgi:hypothetical protein